MPITTIKLSTDTKARLDHLKEYRRETYEDILQRILDILNLCRASPERARSRLIAIDRKKKMDARKSQKVQAKEPVKAGY